jgi:DNA-binding response OmpR family regulator
MMVDEGVMTDFGTDLLGGLKDLYLNQLKLRLSTLEEVMLDVKSGRADSTTYEALRSEAHRLNGTGATYGFPNITTTAQKLETYLASDRRDPVETTKLLNSLMREIVGTLAEKSLDVPAPTGAHAEVPSFSPSPPDYKPTILVADDDPAILKLIQRLLSPWSNVQCSESGLGALSAMVRRHFDLVILDYELSDISGLEVLTQARRMDAGDPSPVMMLSAVREHQMVMRLIAAGAQNYMVKPFTPELLLERVALVLNRQKKTILIVDDDPLIREIFRKRLSQRGHNVVLAINGAQALEFMRKVHPQAILLDRQMPRMNGNEFLQELRRHDDTRDIPVIMLSAQCTSDDIESGYRDGANMYISKPFVPDQVVNCCEDFLKLSNFNGGAPAPNGSAVHA